jgi:DNA-binding NarL/FixJ family response regulator
VIRVLVAAPSPVVRAGLEALVAANPDLVVVGRSAGGPGLANDIAALRPEVVLLELEWRGAVPVLELPDLSAIIPPPALVVLADDPRAAWLPDALRAGVAAVLPREATSNEIIAAIQAAAQGLVTLHPTTVALILPQLAAPARSVTPLTDAHTLTPREIEVLGMLAEGLGNKIIARRLGISEHTVKFHVGSILTKLNAASRTEAVTIGARQGLIML